MFASQTIRCAVGAGAVAAATFAAGHVALTAQGAAQGQAAAAAASRVPPPVQLTTQEDHRRTLGLLGLTEIRKGADGRNTAAPNYANYDEAKASPYKTLPELLVTNGGKKVTTAKDWWNVRRPELVELFDREVYGRMPKTTPKVSWQVVATTEETVGGVTVVKKELLGKVDNSSYPMVDVNIEAALWTPKDAKGPVPVVMEFGSGGRPQPPRPGPVASAPAAGATPAAGAMAPPVAAPTAARVPPPGPSWQEQVVAKGWGYASVRPASIQADNGAGLTQGIIGLMNKGQPRKVDDWGSLRAWAWGASRVLDYFETDKAVDAKRVALEGHSRYGKATLVTMAYEPRLAIAYVSSSGAGGAKIHRRVYGELVENVAGQSEYHWMAGNYIKYAGPLTPNDLPVDAHMLVGMCAPRPVFIGSGQVLGDGWVDAKGMFLAGAHAGPAYRLLGKKDLGTMEFPPIETALVDGEIGFRQHNYGHTPGPNWPTFLTFAERYFTPKAKSPKPSN